MNTYELKQEEKRERLLDAAAKAERRSEAAHKRAQTIADGIPMGQPILVGHHSERHHRADLRRIHGGYQKAFDEGNRAKELERRADAVGTGGISSDDPDAIAKLGQKIERLGRQRTMMKKINRAHAQYLKNPDLDLSGFEEPVQRKIREYTPEYSWEPHPFPPYSFQNLGGRIKQAKERIKRLEAQEKNTYSEVTHGEVTVIEDPDINRLQMIFLGKPNPKVLKSLKSYGFHYTREKAWQRQLTGAARYAAEQVLKEVSS